MTLPELLKELDEANVALKEAIQNTSNVRQAETYARNRVNKTQKEIDAHIAALKEKAEWDTNWHSERNPGRAVT